MMNSEDTRKQILQLWEDEEIWLKTKEHKAKEVKENSDEQ